MIDLSLFRFLKLIVTGVEIRDTFRMLAVGVSFGSQHVQTIYFGHWSIMMVEGMGQLLSAFGVSDEMKSPMELEGWDCYSFNHNSRSRDVPILLIRSGPNSIADLRRVAKRYDTCVLISPEYDRLIIRTLEKTYVAPLESKTEYLRISDILKAHSVDTAKNEIELNAYLENAIDAIPSTAGDFENRGLFSTHYLRNRIFDDAPDVDIAALKNADTDVVGLLAALGWTADATSDMVAVVTTKQENFSIRESSADVAPSYTAISKLSEYRWVILTNGTKWRLYTSRVSASSTNYFEIHLHEPFSEMALQYLGIIFGRGSFEGKNPKIDMFFDRGKEFAAALEEDLASRIMAQDGIMLNLAKGLLSHDMKTIFDDANLVSAKKNALRIIYRVWFVAYAESRNMLPISDKKYVGVSLRNLRNRLDAYESDDDVDSCWKYLLNLFEGIRNGSPKNNLPQYNGNLFRHEVGIDDVQIHNRWIVPVLRDLLENKGDVIDYASLSVRHLGNILENVMEFTIRQAKEDIMFMVKGKKTIQVKTAKDSNYSYKKNDLHLASGEGGAVRKSTASYYTPDEFVTFLVGRGLDPIFAERAAHVAGDVESYQKNPSSQNHKICVDRLLDIQVLDPTMGSGHFLVEALNRITSWATEQLRQHPSHPLLAELDLDRNAILAEQKEKGICIDDSLLTHDILLKRKVMKRCIFGVDLNPMAVEITKLALWLDSFAIGVPLTYMDHHIKEGDSTIGTFLEDLAGSQNQSLDDWMPSQDSNKLLEAVSSSSDVTISQVYETKDRYLEYVRSVSAQSRMLDALAASTIDDTIVPKKSRLEFIHRLGRYDKDDDKIIKNVRKKVSEIRDRLKFFHWELEMRDAFTLSRRGFDLIVGNPPWDKTKPNDDEFFTPYNPAFRSLSSKTKKKIVKEELLKNTDTKSNYESYLKLFKEKKSFYTTYKKQGVGDKDLSKLVLEKALGILADGGIISMVVPSQILSSMGSADLRKEMLQRDILQLYTFENKYKIFDIDSRYRFMLLTLRNSEGKDEFPAGFYLHHLSSLQDKSREKAKFWICSKKEIVEAYPDSLIIPESTDSNTTRITSKMNRDHPKLKDCLGYDTTISLSSGFHKTNDSDLLREDGRGWPLHEGKTIHQYNHMWSNPTFTISPKAGLEHEDKPKYGGMHKKFYESYRLVFREVSSPTNMRTMISTILPPKTFDTYSIRSVVLKQDGVLVLDDWYIETISYLCGIFNSTLFDFAARQIIQMDTSTIIMQIPVPTNNKKKIANLAAKMTVGHDDFAGFAERMRVPNRALSTSERINTAAELDVLVAKSYGLDKDQYKTILDSFKSFRENPDLFTLDKITWNNNNLKEFYGQMAKKALEIF